MIEKAVLFRMMSELRAEGSCIPLVETVEAMTLWLRNLTSVCGGCPDSCNAASGKCKGHEVVAWLK